MKKKNDTDVAISPKPTRVGKYKTYNLDEATWFIINGLRYKSRPMSWCSSWFEFDDTKELEGFRLSFWGGECVIDLHKWIALRQELKNILKGQGDANMEEDEDGNTTGKVKRARVPMIQTIGALRVFHPRNGDKYFYVEDKKIGSMLYGTGDIHQARHRGNNTFESKEDAQVALDRLL